ncbi:MAG: SAM hydrolase/SAM-dependent halogenase family protein [Streptosporangiales bacterium]
MRTVITFLTDFGLDDPYVAICHGVLARFSPESRVVDVTHLVPPQDVRRGAAVLERTVAWYPPAVHLAVVDPGVGTRRRAIAVAAGEHILVGPDNGLLLPAADALGGVGLAVELTDETRFLHPASRTFHGRDVFSPCAGQIAAGTPLPSFGEEIDPAGLVRLPAPRLDVSDGWLTCEVTYVDRFGNLRLSAGPDELAAAGLGDTVAVGVHGRSATVAESYGGVPAGALVLYVESTGALELAVNHGSAAATLELGAGDGVKLTAA